MKTYDQPVKTTVFFDKQLLYEIDRSNPFPTRKEFLVRACRHYLQEVNRKRIDQELAQACTEAQEEDLSVNEDWEPATREDWR